MNEELIKKCLKMPDVPLDADGDYTICYLQEREDAGYLFVHIAGWQASIFFTPEQALTLSDILASWRSDLEAMRVAQITEQAQREQTQRDRINALKARYREAVTAWQEAGGVGACPTFEEIAMQSQLVEVPLFPPSTVGFNKDTPCLDLLRRQ